MRKKLSLAFFLVLSIGSCNTVSRIQVYERYPIFDGIEYDYNDEAPWSREVIVLRKDSTLSYLKFLCDIGGGVSIVKYRLIDNVLSTDSVSINGIDNEKILNARFIYNQDSLVNMDSQERYYHQEYYYDRKRMKMVRYK